MQALRYWVTAIVLVVGGPVFAFSMQADSRNIAKILDHGKTVSASIDKVQWTSKNHIDQDFVLSIDFKTEDGKAVSHKLKVDSGTGKKVRDDNGPDHIDVRYLPENPNVVYPTDVQQPSNSMYGIAALVSLIGIGMIVWRLTRGKRQK